MKKSITMSIIIVLLSTQLCLVVGATEIQESLQESQVLKEISDLRTSHSKTFLIDGKYTQEIFGEGIHFESIDGKFLDGRRGIESHHI